MKLMNISSIKGGRILMLPPPGGERKVPRAFHVTRDSGWLMIPASHVREAKRAATARRCSETLLRSGARGR